MHLFYFHSFKVTSTQEIKFYGLKVGKYAPKLMIFFIYMEDI